MSMSAFAIVGLMLDRNRPRILGPLAAVLSLMAPSSGQEVDPVDEVVLVTTTLSSQARVSRFHADCASRGVRVQSVSVGGVDLALNAAALERARLVLVDVPHISQLDAARFALSAESERADRIVVVLGPPAIYTATSGDETAEPGSASRGVTPGVASRLGAYWSNGGDKNRRALLEVVSALASDRRVISLAEMPEPVVLPSAGFYHPRWGRVESELAAVIARKEHEGRPTVAIAIHKLVLSSDDTAWVDALIGQLGRVGLDAYAFYGSRSNPSLFTEMTCRRSGQSVTPAVDLIVNATLVFRANQRKAELEQIGLPVMQTLPALGMTEEEWRSSAEGLAPSDTSFYLSSSEFAGMIDPTLLSARDQVTGSLAPIESQCVALAQKAAAVVSLRRTPRAERRIAILVYNYPTGERHFGASFLNVPRSLERVLGALGDAGYNVAPADEDAIVSGVQASMGGGPFQAHGDSDGWLGLADYMRWLDGIAPEQKREIIEYWGAPDEAESLRENASGEPGFSIPHMGAGDVIILPQPARFELGRSVDDKTRRTRIGHRSSVPLSHRYLATYLWIRESFDADAVVHFGTHGSVEWAPGKQRGLSSDDAPWLALGALPNIYPYIMDNLGEALTAKRRGRGVMISHLTPMFTPAGFRPGLHAMHDLMHDWETVADGALRNELERELIRLFVEHGLDKDLATTPERIATDFHGFMEDLHPYLDDIAQTAQPQGLAVFGDVPSEERRLGMIMQMLRKPLIDALGEDIDEVFLLDADKVPNSRPARWLRLALDDPEAASVLDLRRIDDLATGAKSPVPNRAKDKELNSDVLLSLAQRAQDLEEALSTNGEMNALLSALDGHHVPSAYGGDPVRNPDSLPTGLNLYGFDPARVPTKQAFEVGRRVFERWLEEYRLSHDGEQPRTVAFSLWAGETMRHQGIMESEALCALGVRPVWDEGGRVVGTERIERSELGRDRIDVLLSVTGSYRDQFPVLMRVMDEAIDDLASDAAQDNAVARASRVQANRLMERGESADRAQRLARRRIFSNEPGVYGTGVNHVVDASELWPEQSKGGGDGQMAELFVQRMGHVYGGGLHGLSAGGLFSDALGRVDAVMASRSSSTYGVLTSDDPFAYVGGLALAARLAPSRESGDAPKMYFQNMRDESEVIIDPAERAIAKELQTRYLHPHWIRAQKDEGYAGTLQVLKAANFIWGWQAVAPETIREDQWQSLFDVYVRDRYELGTLEWFEESNREALGQVLARMADAMRLDYWDPDAETREELLRMYSSVKSDIASNDRHPGVESFVSDQLSEAQASASPDMPVAVEASAERVEGQELRKVAMEEAASEDGASGDRALRWALLLFGLIVVGLVGRSVSLGRS